MPFFGSTPGVPSSLPGSTQAAGIGGYGVIGNPGVIGIGPDVIPTPIRIAWSTTMLYNAPKPPTASGTTATYTYNIGTVPAGLAVGEKSAIYVVLASMPLTSDTDFGSETDNFSVNFTAADGDVISVPFYISAAFDIPFVGNPFGALVYFAVQDPKLALGGSLDLTIIQENGFLQVFANDNGVVVAFLADAANLVLRPYQNDFPSGYGPHGAVGINPPLGDITGLFSGASPGLLGPGPLFDPGSDPIIAAVGRFENVTTTMSVGFPNPEPGWTTIAQINNPIGPVSLLVAFYEPDPVSIPAFNKDVLWNLTSGSVFTVGRNIQMLSAGSLSKLSSFAEGTIAGS